MSSKSVSPDAQAVTEGPEVTAQPDPTDNVIRLGGKTAKTVEYKPLFEIDGTTYSIPTSVRTNVALAIMSKFEREGELGASMFMLRKVLGAEAFDVLTNYDDLDDDDLAAIVGKVTEMVFASGQGASGK